MAEENPVPAPLINNVGRQEPQLVRSYVIPPSDNAHLEKEFIHKLKTGAGPFGTQMINMFEIKKEKLALHGDLHDVNSFVEPKIILKKMELDGVYIDDPEVQQKFDDFNVQKLEERLLNNGSVQFFKSNGELKLDNDLLEDEMTRPVDMAFEKSVAFSTKEKNAMLCDRMHSYKTKYYQLNIMVGKVNFQRCGNFLKEEDILVKDINELHKTYEDKLNLGMIPFYLQRMQFIQNENQQTPNQTDEQKKFLEQVFTEVEKKFETEKKKLNELATKIWEQWLKLQEVRKVQRFRSTTLDLKVNQIEFKKPNGDVQFRIDDFVTAQINITDKREDESSLDFSENQRRHSIRNMKVYAKLIVNDQNVAQTKHQTANMHFPVFEAEICELFQVHVFTMPESIFLELVLVDGVIETIIDKIQVEVPGQHVRTLTSASSCIQAIQFKHFKQKNKDDPSQPSLDEDQKKILQEKWQAKDAHNYRGDLLVKIEWKGQGPKLPPMKHENLFKKKKQPKNRIHLTEEEEELMAKNKLYIDVNDPRNEWAIRLFKETKNKFFMELLRQDSLNMLYNMETFRHALLQTRSNDPLLGSSFIPMLEEELIDGHDRTHFYLDQLEKIYRKKAYDKFLTKRTEGTTENNYVDSESFQIIDLETVRRRQLIYNKISNRAGGKQGQNSNTQVMYKSVVREVEGFQANNPLIGLINKFFIRGRRLKPVVEKREVVDFKTVKKCLIYVHIIKAENVPVRKEFLNAMYSANVAQEKKQQERNQNVRRNNTALPRQSMGPADDDDQDENNEQNQRLRNKEEISNQPQVETFIEAKIIFWKRQDGKHYHEEIHMTAIDEGSMPKWNEVLTFELHPQNGNEFTLEELAQTKAEIVISLFDNQIYKTFQDGKEIRQEENRFLGNISIPLTSVLQHHEKVDYTFTLKRPMVLPSYRVLTDEALYMTEEQLRDENLRKNEEIPTYINLSVSLDPPIEIPHQNENLYYPGAETDYLLTHCGDWMNNIKEKNKIFLKRHIRAFGEDLESHSILLCRFLTDKTAPPADLFTAFLPGENRERESVDNTVKRDPYAIEKVARFVSMIPFKEDQQLFEKIKDMPDIYCTSQEFLDLGQGDYEEHAILLANFFKYIDNIKNPGKFKTYLVYGEAMPMGSTVYVLRKHAQHRENREIRGSHAYSHFDYGGIELWAPMTGECYYYKLMNSNDNFFGVNVSKGFHLEIGRLNDPLCPLRHLYNLVDEDNIYANIQRYDFPVLVDFNLDNKKNWSKMLPDLQHRSEQLQIRPSVNLAPLKIARPLISDTLTKLTSRIRTYLVDMFQEERIRIVRKTTKWFSNIRADDQIQQLLQQCELHSQMTRKGGITSTLKEPGAKQEFFNSDEVAKFQAEIVEQTSKNQRKRFWGFPLNCTWTSAEDLWKQVSQTKMHTVNRQDVEFALTVYIHAYPSNVLSVWIYLAAYIDLGYAPFTRQ